MEVAAAVIDVPVAGSSCAASTRRVAPTRHRTGADYGRGAGGLRDGSDGPCPRGRTPPTMAQCRTSRSHLEARASQSERAARASHFCFSTVVPACRTTCRPRLRRCSPSSDASVSINEVSGSRRAVMGGSTWLRTSKISNVFGCQRVSRPGTSWGIPGEDFLPRRTRRSSPGEWRVSSFQVRRWVWAVTGNAPSGSLFASSVLGLGSLAPCGSMPMARDCSFRTPSARGRCAMS